MLSKMDKGEEGGGKRGHGRQDGHGSDEDVLEVHLGAVTSAPDLESEWIEVSKTTLTTTLSKEPSNNPAPDHVVSFPANFLLLSPRPHPILSGPKNLDTSFSSNSSFPSLHPVDIPINPKSTTIPLITMVSPPIPTRSTNSNSNLSNLPNANTNAREVLLEISPNRNLISLSLNMVSPLKLLAASLPNRIFFRKKVGHQKYRCSVLRRGPLLGLGILINFSRPSSKISLGHGQCLLNLLALFHPLFRRLQNNQNGMKKSLPAILLCHPAWPSQMPQSNRL